MSCPKQTFLFVTRCLLEGGNRRNDAFLDFLKRNLEEFFHFTPKMGLLYSKQIDETDKKQLEFQQEMQKLQVRFF